MANPLSFLSLSLVALVVSCGGGGGSSTPAARNSIGPNGGALAVPAGPLAGTQIEFPPGAVARSMQVTITQARARAHPGFRSIGPAATIGPTSTSFPVPFRLTLPFTANLRAGNDVVILSLSATGDIVELGPTTHQDEPQQLASVEATTCATFWVAERLFGGFPTRAFLPLDDGNRWNFDNGVTLSVFESADEPNLGGLPVYRLQIDMPLRSMGFYLRRSSTGATASYGRYEAMNQEVHGAALFVPARVTIGQPISGAWFFESYAPLGSTQMADRGTATLRLLATIPDGDVETAAGTFDDVLQIDADATFTDGQGRQRQEPYRLTLARGIGPVHIEFLGVGAGLVDGYVSGEPIGE